MCCISCNAHMFAIAQTVHCPQANLALHSGGYRRWATSKSGVSVFHWVNSSGEFCTHSKGAEMNWDIVKSNWNKFKERLKARWGNIVGDQPSVLAGRIGAAGKPAW